MTNIELQEELRKHPDDMTVCGLMLTVYPDVEIEYFRITEISTEPYADIVESFERLSYNGYRYSKKNENVLVLQ